MPTEIVIYLVFGLVLLFVLFMGILLWIQKENLSRQNLLIASLLKEQNLSHIATTTKLNQNLNDSFTDKFYYLNKFLNEGIDRQNRNLNGNLKDINESFNTLLEKVAKIEAKTKIDEEIKDEIMRLNTILSNQKLRGNFGEQRLERILQTVYGENEKFYEMQKTLPNGKIADCALHTRENKILCVDSKFPLTNYERICDANNEKERINFEKELAKDMKKHISDIANKYILPPFTNEYAVLFLPSEAVFVYVCEKMWEVLEFGAKQGVFLSSPTTFLSLVWTLRLFERDEMISQNVKMIKSEIFSLNSAFASHIKNIKTMENYAAKFYEQSQILTKNSATIKEHFDKFSNL